MTSRELFQELDTFFFLQTEDDILRCPDNRPEYQPYVNECKAEGIEPERIPTVVLGMLLAESLNEEKSLWRRIKKIMLRCICFRK